MNDLISYLMQRLQQGGTSVAPSGGPNSVQAGGTSVVPYSPNSVTAPGTSLVPKSPNIIDGEWSEVPRGLNGPNPMLNSPSPGLTGPGGRAMVPSGGNPVANVGSRALGGMAGGMGSFGGIANPLMAAVMGSIQGDVLNNHRPRMYGAPAPANPAGDVTSAPMPPVQPDASFNDRFGSMDPAALAKGDMLNMPPNLRVANGFPPQMAASAPMPRPRPQMLAPAVGPTSVGGAPLQNAPQAAPPQPMSFFQHNAASMRDPATGAFIDPQAAAQAQGQGGIIPKMIGLLNNKANNAAVGPTSVGGAPLQNAQRPNGGLLSQLMWHLNGNGNG